MTSRTTLIATAALGVSAFGAAGGGLSGAFSKSSEARREQIVASGHWSGLSAANLKPGESRSREMKIVNTGSREGTFTLTEKHASNPFGANLQLVIADVAAGRSVYSGELGSAGSIELGSLAAGAQRTYRFTVKLAASAPNGAQGRTATAEYRWKGTRR